ncbi:GFA family protein [Streptomyces goshikiensis]|uniref:GFA family protein n=1 Tax=Streptomyces goshikiensis TaxID=1942 RepID=UPI0036B27FA9
MNATAAEDTEERIVRTGGCRCGLIRFTVTGPADYPHTCSCPDCQKLCGGPVMWWAGFPHDQITWSGWDKIRWFETFQGEAKRGFCPDCGTRLAAIDSDIPDLGINVTALNDTTGADLVPVNQSFRETAVHWLSQVPNAQASTTG